MANLMVRRRNVPAIEPPRVCEGHPLAATVPVLRVAPVGRVTTASKCDAIERSGLPLLRDPPENRLFVELRGLVAGGPELAVRRDASGEEVVHQAGLGLMRLGDQAFGLLDNLVNRRQNLCNRSLLSPRGDLNRRLLNDGLG